MQKQKNVKVLVAILFLVSLIGIGEILVFGGSRQDTLVVANIGAVRTLDPAVAYDTKTYVPIQNIYEPLITFKSTREEGRLVVTEELASNLATDWNISSDGLKYTFNLRQGVKFHSGDVFDADAVKYSLERTISMAQGPAWILSEHIKDINILDDYTIEIELNAPYAPFMRILADETCAYIVNPATVEAHGGVKYGETNEWMISHEDGTGPFKLESWDPGTELVLAANKDYWRGAPKLEKVVLRVVKEPSTQMMLLQSGAIDVIALGLTWKDIASLEGMSGIEVYMPESWTEVRFFFLNTTKPPFDDVAVRRAISYAVDYKGIIETVLYGYGKRLTGPLPEGYLCYDPTLQLPYNYNPGLAKRLLAAAGYPEGFEVEVSYPSADYERVQVSEIIRANLEAIGITSTAVGYSWPVILDKWDRGEMQMAATKWAPTPDPDVLLTSMFHTEAWGAGGNYSFFSDKTVDGLLDIARTTTSEEERCRLYRKAQRIIINDAPWLFLYQPKRAFPIREVVKDFAMPALEEYNFFPVYKTGP
jgi:peptide/nickel transport system substrate-binding protein